MAPSFYGAIAKMHLTGGKITSMAQPKIVAIMRVYNEADILEQTIRYMGEQGIPLVIVDEESNDGSLEIERAFLGKGVLEVRTLHPSPYHELKDQLKEAYELALQYSPDWIVSDDADEFLESPYPNTTLREGIGIVDALGFNLIQFNCFDFCLTEKDFQSTVPDVRKRLKYYTYHSDYYFRAWKHYPGTDLLSRGGHKPIFPDGVEERIPSIKFVNRHYRFRSLQHAMRKVFRDRLPRYSPTESANGWHVHYNNLKPDPNYFIIPSSKLNRYDEDGNWNFEKKIDPFFGAWKPPNSEEHLSTNELISKLSQQIDEASSEIEHLSGKLDQILRTHDSHYEKLQEQLNAIYRFLPVRVYLNLKRRLGLIGSESG
jgi:glycosyltransferase involved in cell wall biosynthesis